ncbi:sensor histidine kinase [Nocardioides gansuensis]|nr:HAMP domain-containing sensor histidine kinase [Nocardioides gansuensis]
MRTLTSRLVVTAVALVALVALLISVATTLAMAAYLRGQLDDDVRGTLMLTFGDRAVPPGPAGHQGDRPGGPPDRDGQRLGSLIAVIGSDHVGGEVVTSGVGGLGSRESLDDEALTRLSRVPTDGEGHEVRLPGLGAYRVVAVQRNGTQLVAGLPPGNVDDTLASLITWEIVLSLLGVAAAAAAGTIVVRRQLAPLREVAATAHRVAELPLSEGEIALDDRVPARLTDERNEVGQVGSALNTLLTHVESSLAARHRSEQQVRQFVADASHELRTPLATIAGYTELARRRPEATPTALDKVESESARMTALVEDLLLLARLDAGRQLAAEPVDLTQLLAEAVNDARVVAPDHHWRLVLPDEPVEVTGDGARLHQVVTNLLANTRTHTPGGTTVTVTATPDGLEVHDDGPGFPPDLVEHAFERFARGDAARSREGGVGLGLALVQSIVAAHGGSVSLSSEPGDTTVRVSGLR